MGPISPVKSSLVGRNTNDGTSTCTQKNINTDNSTEDALNALITYHKPQNISIAQQKNMSGQTLNISIDNKVYELEVSDYMGMVIGKIHENINSTKPINKSVEILKAIDTATQNYKLQQDQLKICNEDIDIINYLIKNTIKNNTDHLWNTDSQVLQALIGLQSHQLDNPNYNYSLGTLINEYSRKLANHSDITQHLDFAAALIASAGSN